MENEKEVKYFLSNFLIAFIYNFEKLGDNNPFQGGGGRGGKLMAVYKG